MAIFYLKNFDLGSDRAVLYSCCRLVGTWSLNLWNVGRRESFPWRHRGRSLWFHCQRRSEVSQTTLSGGNLFDETPTSSKPWQTSWSIWKRRGRCHGIYTLLFKLAEPRLITNNNELVTWKLFKRHQFFRKLDWESLLMKKIQPPFRPQVESPKDTRNFDEEFTSESPVSLRFIYREYQVFKTLTPPRERRAALTPAQQEQFRQFNYIAHR